MSFIDLRSDTATRPTAAMRAAMAAAEVGDDVLGEDPTIRGLEERIAATLAKEAAVFVPSGTMSNQIGVRLHCQPGDEVILESGCHIYNHEQGGLAQLSGLATRTLDGERGMLRLEQIQNLIRPDNIHYVRTRLVCLENTHNRAGGAVLPYDQLEQLCSWAHERGLATHLDGARLFNAVVASGISADRWAQHFDTVSVCFSKGLGAPVGSALCGTRAAIRTAVRIRKLLGGGMRQAGIIAAGALYALEHHVERLAEDHAHAALLADAVRATEGLSLRHGNVETNIVFFDMAPELGTASEFCGRLRERGVLAMAENLRTIRAVTHLDVSREQIVRACSALGEAASSAASNRPATAVRSAYA
ncbi:MAG TPA: low-specificity L-threonine aldolase [Pirellulales bacterium]|jgi:threonine aldolase|nr:low-specificity L-threonine aldolase [Pirellulales bacterium]